MKKAATVSGASPNVDRAATAELHQHGYCILRSIFPAALIEDCRDAFAPVLAAYLGSHPEPNRGPCRHFFPMPFTRPCFAPEFFFSPAVRDIVRAVLGDRIVADQWGCDVALPGSTHQGIHVDFQRPLFDEAPDLALPPYMLVISFGLVPIALENGPIYSAPGTHRMPRPIDASELPLDPITLAIGDVLIRHPWALHRGTPNTNAAPRPLVSIRYVRDWYTDSSRDVAALSRSIRDSLTPSQQRLLRFPIAP